MNSKVSIIIPTRNRQELLSHAIRSAANQTYRNLQIIIHDNNSSDGTKELIQPLLQDARIEYHRSENDLTMTENWNSAFQKVKGDYFVRLDDDNVLYPDYVESALHAIEHHHLSVMMFSPLCIKPRGKTYTFFDPEEKILLLTQKQWLFLEYFSLTDSNYAMYETKAIKDLFPDNNVYQTSLPDRYMNYKCIDAIPRKGIQIGFSSLVKGITRFDNQRPAETSLSFVDYSRINRNTIASTVDCHYNFFMHRLLTIGKALEESKNEDLKYFFHKNITSEHFQLTLMQMGHIYRLQRASSFREAILYGKYATQILISLAAHPLLKLEGTSIFPHIARLLQKVVRYYRYSLNPREEGDADKLSYGNKVVKALLKTGKIEEEEAASLYGNVDHYLKNISV